MANTASANALACFNAKIIAKVCTRLNSTVKRRLSRPMVTRKMSHYNSLEHVGRLISNVQVSHWTETFCQNAGDWRWAENGTDVSTTSIKRRIYDVDHRH